MTLRRSAGLVLCLLAGCARVEIVDNLQLPKTAFAGDNLEAACVAEYDPAVDYFPHKSHFEHSTQLDVTYAKHYKRVRFVPGVETRERLEFLFVQCGTPVPEHDANTVVVEVPIRRLAVANDSILDALARLDAQDVLIGVPSVRSITVPSIKARADAGAIEEMYGWGHVSIEPVIAAQPDVYLTFYSAYPSGNLHPTLWRLGVRALPGADHLEAHPLGRAEWIKLFGLLLNREARANAEFSQIEREYLAIRDAVRAAAPATKLVLAGYASTRDDWDAFGTHNFQANLIADAGGRYFIDDVPIAGSWVVMPFEKAYARGARADAWIGGLSQTYALGENPASKPIYRWFRPVERGEVYAFDRGYVGAYAYPYHDQGATRPHHALADIVRALHPGLLPEAELHFLRKFE